MSDYYKSVPRDDETMDMIKKLKDRGFAVIERGFIRTIGAREVISKDTLLASHIPAERIVKKNLARAIAEELCQYADFPIRETQRGLVNVQYETRFQWIGSKVDPLDSDYPLYLGADYRQEFKG